MLKKTLAAAFLIASGPLSANELADLVNDSGYTGHQRGNQAVGGMWEYSVGGIVRQAWLIPA